MGQILNYCRQHKAHLPLLAKCLEGSLPGWVGMNVVISVKGGKAQINYSGDIGSHNIDPKTLFRYNPNAFLKGLHYNGGTEREICVSRFVFFICHNQ